MDVTPAFAIAFHIGSFAIRWYSIFALIGIIITCGLITFCAWRRKLPMRPLEYFLIPALLASFIGARAWYLVGSHANIHNFVDVINVTRGGIAIEGGVVTALVVSVPFFYKVQRHYGVSMWSYLDIVMINVLIGQIIGRWGNFFNQEILGPMVSRNSFPLNILPHFIVDHLHGSKEPSGIYRQPLFLWEGFFNFWAWFAFFFIAGKHWYKTKLYKKFNMQNIESKYINKILNYKLRPGSLGICWFIWYGFLRVILEPLRDNSDFLNINGFSTSIFISAMFLVGGVIWFMFNQRIIYNQNYQELMQTL